jgi:GNAT superfamily N-acetyltransferase
MINPVPRIVTLDHEDFEVARRIVEIQHGAYSIEAALIGFSGVPPLSEAIDDVRALDLTMIGVLNDGEVVAILGYRRVGDVVDIDRLAVEPHHFRRGYARLLLEHLHTAFSGAGITVSTGADNLPAVYLYESLGWERLALEELPAGVTIVRFMRSAIAESS